MNIECMDVKGIKSDFLKAIAKIKFPDFGIIVNEVKLFHKNDRYWVSMPDKPYIKDGEKKFYRLVQFVDPKVEVQVLKDIKDAIMRMLEEGKRIEQTTREDSGVSFDMF